MPWIRITCLVALAAMASACGASRKELRAAKTSGYQADFAVVYSQTLAAVTELYPNLIENAAAGVIKTQWHPIRMQTGQEAASGSRNVDPDTGLPSSQNPFGAGGRIERVRYFIRFDVHVVGGKPWRVRVRGKASRWEAGDAMPVELRDADEPHWLQGRIDALQVAIYERLKEHAVPLQLTSSDDPVEAPEEDLSRYGQLPTGAAEAIAAVEKAARAHDFTTLRAHMADNFTWSLGAAPNADQAVAMWQADSSRLRALVEIIEAGCRPDSGGERVTCPPEYTEEEGYLGHRVGFAPSGDGWKMIFFVEGD